MKRTSFTVDLSNVRTLEVVLRHYLSQFAADDLRTAAPGSQIQRSIEMLNRCKNISHGTDVEWCLERPAFASASTGTVRAEYIRLEIRNLDGSVEVIDDCFNVTVDRAQTIIDRARGETRRAPHTAGRCIVFTRGDVYGKLPAGGRGLRGGGLGSPHDVEKPEDCA